MRTIISSLGTLGVNPKSFRPKCSTNGINSSSTTVCGHFSGSPSRVCEILRAQVCRNPQGWPFGGVADQFYFSLAFGIDIPFKGGCSSCSVCFCSRHTPLSGNHLPFRAASLLGFVRISLIPSRVTLHCGMFDSMQHKFRSCVKPVTA